MTPLQSYVMPGSRCPGLWRPVIGMVLIALLWVLGVFTALFVYGAYLGPATSSIGVRLNEFANGATATATILLLASPIFVWIGIWVVGRLLHGQPFATFFAPDRRLHAGLLAKGLAFGALLTLLPIGISLQWSDAIRTGLEVGEVAILFLPIVVLVFVQATAEELVFRGYLLQQLAWRFPHWLVWALLPSLVFGWLHYDERGPLDIYWAISSFFTGLLLCVLVWRSGSLWAAIGAHVGINVVAFTVLGIEGVFSGTQLWVIDVYGSPWVVQVDLVISGLALLLVLSPAGRIFNAPAGATAD